jgi:hypothetical protein
MTVITSATVKRRFQILRELIADTQSEFGVYWRMGLPLEINVIVVATPTILYVWPLY